MTDLTAQIQNLSDNDAKRILTTFARYQAGYEDDPLTQETAPDLSTTNADEAELAREMLLVLAEDPIHRPVIEALVTGPAPQKMGATATALTLFAVTFLLRTNIKYERKADGRWTFKIEHKPADSKMLQALLNKLSAILPTGGES